MYLFISIILFSCCSFLSTNVNCEEEDSVGIGFAFSGAGGRIGQHLALAEALVKGTYPGGVPIRPNYLSGASSGTLSSVIVNAIIESSETGRIGYTWDNAKALLFSLTTSDVIDDSLAGIAKIEKNILDGYILDNTPMVNLLKEIIGEFGYNTLGDLYVPTAISVVNQSTGYTLRLWSDDPKYAHLDLLEVIMASCSLPLAFTPRKITGLGDTLWIDGGTGIDTLPVFALANRPEVNTIYVACYGSAMTSGGASVPSWLESFILLKNVLATIDDMRVDLFVGGIDILSSQTAKKAYSYIPNLNQTFSVLDFEEEKLEYTLVMEWTLANPPHKLN